MTVFLLSIILILIVLNYSSSGSTSTDIIKVYTKLSNKKGSRGNAITTDTNGSIYITGSIKNQTSSMTDDDIILIKYSSNGKKIYTKIYGTNTPDVAKAIIYNNNYIYITGFTYGSLDEQKNKGGKDIFITKCNSNDGKTIWTKLIGTSGNEIGNAIAIDSNGNIWITGETNGYLGNQASYGEEDIALMKISPDGDINSINVIGSNGYDVGYGITIDNQNNIFITGYTTSDNFYDQQNTGGADVFVMKYSSHGSHEWTKLIGSTGWDGNKNSYYIINNKY
jgi:hypothetical protein